MDGVEVDIRKVGGCLVEVDKGNAQRVSGDHMDVEAEGTVHVGLATDFRMVHKVDLVEEGRQLVDHGRTKLELVRKLALGRKRV